MKKLLLLIVLTLLFSNFSDAQSSYYKWGAGVHPSLYSFYAADEGIFSTAAYESGVQFSLSYYLSKSLDIGLELGSGVIRHPELKAAVDAGLRDRLRDNFHEANLAFRLRMDNGVILPKDFFISPFLKAGIGVNTYETFGNISGFAPIGAGINFRLGKVAAGIILQSTYNIGFNGRNYLHHSIGLSINFGKKKSKIDPNKKKADRDYDGIADAYDLCPDIFGTVKSRGCPDLDNDGVRDTEDQCPDVKGYSNYNGCLDSDYDGVKDPEDACPNQYGTSADGCPDVQNLDRDGDGVIDIEDSCPDIAGFYTAKGCPDKDGDGIKDSEDKCPDYFGKSEFNGCPVEPAAFDLWLKRSSSRQTMNQFNTSATTMGIQSSPSSIDCAGNDLNTLGKDISFNSGSATLKQTSYQVLNQLVNALNQCSSYKLVIIGHTDSDGSESSNQSLSERRAFKVLEFLAQKGIPADRLASKGYGESKPIVPNDNANNKSLNRRVEFQINK